jgi:hypothetical protein
MAGLDYSEWIIGMSVSENKPPFGHVPCATVAKNKNDPVDISSEAVFHPSAFIIVFPPASSSTHSSPGSVRHGHYVAAQCAIVSCGVVLGCIKRKYFRINPSCKISSGTRLAGPFKPMISIPLLAVRFPLMILGRLTS